MKIIIGVSIALLVMAAALIIKKISQERGSPLPIIASLKDKDLKMIFGENAVPIMLKNPFPYIKVFSADGEIAGYLFSSGDLNIINHGYKTEVKLFIATDSHYKIKEVILNDIKETPEYVAKIMKSGMIEQWHGRGFPDIPPDTVTGATRTSSAINQSVAEALRKINSL